MRRAALLLLLLLPVAVSACSRPRRLSEIGEELPPGAAPVPTGLGADAPMPPQTSPPPGADLRTAPLSFAPIAHKADPSVVTITVVEDQSEVSPFTGRVRRRKAEGLGSGFVIDRTGTIVTNNHVVGDAESIVVRLSDEREFPGKLIATDKTTDMAVVHIDAKDLTPLPLGDSDKLEVGDWVVAIGNPYGLSHTVSAGILSAKGRTNEDVPLDPSGYYSFLQTDASINPGNSGGPLLNLRGEVVGINTAVNREAQGIGFAIPINMVKQLLPMLLRDGHVTRSAIGVRIADARQLSSDELQQLGLPAGKPVQGAIVEGVVPGGPADKAGLKVGDVVVAFEGQPVERSAQLRWLASTTGVGRTVTLRVERAAQTFEVKATLARLEGPPSAPR